MRHYLSLLILLFLAVTSCKDDEPKAGISNVLPLSGGYGTVVFVDVKNLDINATNCLVKFNQKAGDIIAVNSTQIQVKVPKGAGTGPITVESTGHVLNGPDFTYVLTPTVSTIAGNGKKNTKDGSVLDAEFDAPDAIATDSKGNIYVVTQGVIRKFTKGGTVSTLTTPNYYVSGVAVDKNDNLYASGATYILKVLGDKNFSILVNTYKVSGNNDSYDNIAIGTDGTIYAVDVSSNKVYRITSAGIVTVLAGQTKSGYLDGDSKTALFNQPRSIAIDASNNILVTDFFNYCLRKITPEGIVSTVVGKQATGCSSVDGTISQAQLCVPLGICVDGSGGIFISETIFSKIRLIKDGNVKSVAGTGRDGYIDGVGTTAQFYTPSGMCVARDGTNTIYISDFANNRIRMLSFD